MRDADAELKMLADNGIHLDIATEQAYRAVLANENAAVEVTDATVATLSKPSPKPPLKKLRR
jgi:hypothetical protein